MEEYSVKFNWNKMRKATYMSIDQLCVAEECTVEDKSNQLTADEVWDTVGLESISGGS